MLVSVARRTITGWKIFFRSYECGSVTAASFCSQVSAAAKSLIPSVAVVKKYESFGSVAEMLVLLEEDFPLNYDQRPLTFSVRTS